MGSLLTINNCKQLLYTIRLNDNCLTIKKTAMSLGTKSHF